MQSMLDDPPGFRQYWSADYHNSHAGRALDVFLAAGASRPSPLTQHLMLPWGGAVAEVSDTATPLTQRSAAWVTHPSGPGKTRRTMRSNITWVRDYHRAIAPYATGGTYLNFIGDEGDERITAAFGEHNLRRLRDIKSEHDPDNIFAGNQNIRPAVAA